MRVESCGKRPGKAKFFRQFANTDEVESGIEFVTERGQKHPTPWPSELVTIDRLRGSMPRGWRRGAWRIVRQSGSMSALSTTSRSTAAARLSTGRRRSPSSASNRETSGTRRKIPARTNGRRSFPAESSAISEASRKSRARYTRRPFRFSPANALALKTTVFKSFRFASMGTTFLSNCLRRMISASPS